MGSEDIYEENDDMTTTTLDPAELGRIAYKTYCTKRGGRAYDGSPIPDWADMRPGIRDAWAAAALHVARTVRTADAEQGQRDSDVRRPTIIDVDSADVETE